MEKCDFQVFVLFAISFGLHFSTAVCKTKLCKEMGCIRRGKNIYDMTTVGQKAVQFSTWPFCSVEEEETGTILPYDGL